MYYKKVKDLPDNLQLITDSQDIKATLESVGKLDQLEDVGCLFVEVGNADYIAVYGCESQTPRNENLVWNILDT